MKASGTERSESSSERISIRSSAHRCTGRGSTRRRGAPMSRRPIARREHPRPHRAPDRDLHRHPRRRRRSSSARSCSPTACARRSTTCSPRSAENVDLEVRSAVAFGDDDGRRPARPDPGDLARRRSPRRRRRRRRRAAAAALRPDRRRPTARSVTTQGAPTLGVAWTGNDDARRGSRSSEGTAPAGGRPGRHRQGDRRPRGPRRRRPDRRHHRHRHAPVHAHRRSSASATRDGFAGATLAAWDSADRAARCSAPTGQSTRSTSSSPTAPTRRR